MISKIPWEPDGARFALTAINVSFPVAFNRP